ncbi:MAG: hypothetical protein LBB86_06550 [Oscillospiraceae bacterium]|nr:hypothetical protein [Oscillospiraceae bacterium]
MLNLITLTMFPAALADLLAAPETFEGIVSNTPTMPLTSAMMIGTAACIMIGSTVENAAANV